MFQIADRRLRIADGAGFESLHTLEP